MKRSRTMGDDNEKKQDNGGMRPNVLFLKAECYTSR